MGLASQYAVLCLWSAVCVRPQDPPSLNSNTNPTSPCVIIIGDNPYTKCDADTNPNSSSEVTKSDSTTVSTTVINPTSTTTESSTTKPKPATIAPTVHSSPNSPDETKFTTQSPVIVHETVHKNQEDGQNKDGSPHCASVWMGTNTVFLSVVCGVLMLIVVTLSFCLYKQCKKQPVENLHLTRLISIPNPAFYNP